MYQRWFTKLYAKKEKDVERDLEIRLYESLPDGCSVSSSLSHFRLSIQVDQPWSHVIDVLQKIKGQVSETELFRIRLLFESFVREREFTVTEEYVSIHWSAQAKTSDTTASHLNL
jgi:hypothetical protein